jgi:putative ABC transport system ATP-binding protein
MILTEQLTKVFRTEAVETTALRDVDLDIRPGEFVAVMGPSGCGKSTLLNVLGLLDTPTGGRYRFLDRDVAGYSERQRAELRKSNIGFVFQNFNLIGDLTIFENVELPLVYQGEGRGRRRRRVEELLERFGLSPRRNHFPPQLSGGQQQRAAVARAVVGAPRLILADEPTGNLDSTHGHDVMNTLVELNGEGTTIVMVTHSQEYASFARRAINLFDGCVVTELTGRASHV